MTITLRSYQSDLIDQIESAWLNGCDAPLAVMATGGGKTIVFSQILQDTQGQSVLIAHRQELISQPCLALARAGVLYKIIASQAAIREIIALEEQEIGRSHFHINASVTVASVDTLIRRLDDPRYKSWGHQVRLVVYDEGHHVLKDNKWGKCRSIFPNARILGLTATPERADGKGLGVHHDGVFDRLIVGPDVRELTHLGWLSPFRIFCPPNDLDLSAVPVTASGDFSPTPLGVAVEKSRIIGDVVEHYRRLAYGKRGIVFAANIKHAVSITEAFTVAGIPAALVTSETPVLERNQIVRNFRDGQLWVLVNVDIFGEGFDLPSVEVICMARPTESFGLFAQQFGRGLRTAPGKSHTLILDHVGNVKRHGLPIGRPWTLNRRDKRTNNTTSEIRLTTCLVCFFVFPSSERVCPNCNAPKIVMLRSSPKECDGDLTELSLTALTALMGEVKRVDTDGSTLAEGFRRAGMPDIAARGFEKKHRERQEAQQLLRHSIAVWAGGLHGRGVSDSEIYRTFYRQFGMDILTAQTLGAPEAGSLRGRIMA